MGGDRAGTEILQWRKLVRIDYYFARTSLLSVPGGDRHGKRHDSDLLRRWQGQDLGSRRARGARGGRGLVGALRAVPQDGRLGGARGAPARIDVALPAQSFGFVWTLSDAEKVQMREVYAAFWRELAERAEGYDVFVADELLDAINLGLVDLAGTVAWLRRRPVGLEVVLTGRDPAPELVELADYVSEVQKVKHPFDRGVAARRGIEY